MSGTGYTYKVVEGKINKFEDFAKVCFRAFGASVHMRDEDIYSDFRMYEYDGRNEKQLEEYKDKLYKLQNMDDDDYILERREKLDQELIYQYQERERRVQERERVKRMIEKVEKYDDKEDYGSIKRFMEDQLRITLNSLDTDYYDRRINDIETTTNDDILRYKKKMIEMYEEDIEHTRTRIIEDKERYDKDKEWVEGFFKSIKGYDE